MEAVFTQQQGTYERGVVAQLLQAASEDWWKPGHPGWAIWPADSEHFLRQVCDAGSAVMRPVQITAPVPATPHHPRAGEQGQCKRWQPQRTAQRGARDEDVGLHGMTCMNHAVLLGQMCETAGPQLL